MLTQTKNESTIIEQAKKNIDEKTEENNKSIPTPAIPTSEHIRKKEELLLRSIEPGQKKKEGIFFTPENLSKLAAEALQKTEAAGAILDPACGTGNLLVETAKLLPIEADLADTLRQWNEKLFGLDINSKFITLTKTKLVALAVERGSKAKAGFTLKQYISLFKNIKKGDFIKEHEKYHGLIKNLLMNPPFCQVDTPSFIKWTSGKSNAAAIFTYLGLKIIPSNGKVVAILPDVLRSGSRYSEWRNEIKNLVSYENEIFGSFQKDVQVDVYILTGARKQIDFELQRETLNAPKTRELSNIFDVSVGPVVPHRDEKAGQEAPFAHAKILEPWGIVEKLDERIRHKGRKIIPPFIAIRRTSSPKDRSRIIASIVNCSEPVAVENHIIIAAPKDKSLETCIAFLKYLNSTTVNTYINETIRCRHLTVGIVKSIPITEMPEYA